MDEKPLLIFLDFDEVLNNETDRSLQQTRFSPENCYWVAKLIKDTKAKVVISSSWKYLINKNILTIKGIGYLLLTHGICQVEDVIGVTTTRMSSRQSEILEYLEDFNVEKYLVLDDLNLPSIPDSNKIETSTVTGFTEKDYLLAIEKIADWVVQYCLEQFKIHNSGGRSSVCVSFRSNYFVKTTKIKHWFFFTKEIESYPEEYNTLIGYCKNNDYFSRLKEMVEVKLFVLGLQASLTQTHHFTNLFDFYWCCECQIKLVI